MKAGGGGDCSGIGGGGQQYEGGSRASAFAFALWLIALLCCKGNDALAVVACNRHDNRSGVQREREIGRERERSRETKREIEREKDMYI